MILQHTILHAVACFLFFTAEPPTAQYALNKSPEEVLMQVSRTLQGLSAIEYTYQRELSYPSESYYHKLKVDTYLEFTSAAKITGFKYQAEDPSLLQVNNGTEIFIINKKNRTIAIDRNPSLSSVENLSFLYNSPITLREILPTILANATIPKTIVDTLINNTSLYIITFELKGKAINNLGGFRALSAEVTTKYRLTVDKETYFPTEILQTSSPNSDFIKTSFTEVDLTPIPPAEDSWYYSSYTGKYAPEKEAKNLTLIEAGKLSPSWRLPDFETDASIEIDRHKNKVVLLEFWNRNCSYSIAAVPKLNGIYDKYRGKSFQLLAINVYDSKEAIKLFQQKNKPNYTTLYNGEAVAKIYGVSYYPTVVLIDKKGKILYAGEFRQEQLEKLIEKSL